MNNAFKFFVLLAGLLAIGVVLFSGGLVRSAKVVHSMNPAMSTSAPAPAEGPLARPTPDPRAPRLSGPPPAVIQGEKAVTEPVSHNLVITNWQEPLDQIIADTETDAEAKAANLFHLFPQLPPEGQEACAQHLSNLVPDEHYAALGTLLTNSVLPEPVLDTLMSDVLNRPNNIKLPALLLVAQDARHPKAEEAHDILELQIDGDYGTDWALWEQRVQQWLQAQPMQEDPAAATPGVEPPANAAPNPAARE
jgi:hypothetical protein